MRLYEFTNAQEQLGLLRVIIDNTWTAIAQQAKQQKDAEAQRKVQTKAVPRKAKGGRHMGKRVPTPHQPPPKKLPTPQVQQATLKPTPVQTAVAPRKPLPTPTTNIAEPIPPSNQATAPNDGYLGWNASAIKRLGVVTTGIAKMVLACLKIYRAKNYGEVLTDLGWWFFTYTPEY